MLEIINKICADLPYHWEINLKMESGAATVVLVYAGREVDLPDTADKTLTEQLNDALCVATRRDQEWRRGCHEDINHFIGQLMEERKAQKPKPPRYDAVYRDGVEWLDSMK